MSKRFVRMLCAGIFYAIAAKSLVSAAWVDPNNSYVWSISENETSVSNGCCVTEAVLNIHNPSYSPGYASPKLHIRLLPSCPAGFEQLPDQSDTDYFSPYGLALGQYTPENLPQDMISIPLSSINIPSNQIHTKFAYPSNIRIADGTYQPLSTAILYLMDSLGAGKTITFGIDADGIAFDALTLELTITSYTGTASQQTLTASWGNLNSPEIAPIAPKTVMETDTLTFPVTASDADNDSLTIWASNLPAGAVFANNQFSWTPPLAARGTYTVWIYASDGSRTTALAVPITVTIKRYTYLRITF